jgi:acyl-CoA hydrolase
MTYKVMSADEAAAFVNNGDIVGFSGFTPAGCPKEVPTAIAKRAEAAHAEGKEFKIGMYTGASTGDSLDLPAELRHIRRLGDAGLNEFGVTGNAGQGRFQVVGQIDD